MKRSRDVVDDQVVDPPLNLPLTISSELINSFETCLRERYTCSSQQTSSSNTSSPPEKLKALNFPISKITVGDWTYDATNPEDIVAKFYFAKKKLLWEFLGHETNKLRVKKKIEMQWDDVLSFQRSFNSRDETGILKIELKKRPTFFEETNPQRGKHTQWKQLDYDFTSDQAARCRIHTLHFQPGVLQKNLEKLMSISFWSELYQKVCFPSQEGIYFDDIDYGSNNNNAINNSSGHIPSQTPRF